MPVHDRFSFDQVISGPSGRMRAVFEVARVVSAGDMPLVICGETGTGKELLARVIHHSSARREGPFVAASCAGASITLVESELFGHERGAFPDALRERQGRIERADGGTLFLDDVDELPVASQAKLARVLREQRVERLGSAEARPVNLRVIAASRRDLAALAAEGRFDADLHLALSVISVAVPPLRERREDVLVLARHFLEGAAARRNMPVPVVPAHIAEALLRYAWPGNVRELENACERMVQTCTCGTVRTGCLAPQILFHGDADVAIDAPAGLPLAEPLAVSLDDRLREVEAQLIAWALRASNGNKSRAAELLHIKRTTLADRITRHGPELLAAAGLGATATAAAVVEDSRS